MAVYMEAKVGSNNTVGILSDIDILRKLAKEEIVISPLLDIANQIGSASIDVRLGTEFAVQSKSRHTHIDFQEEQLKEEAKLKRNVQTFHINDPSDSFILHPGEFALGKTLEYIKLPNNVIGLIEGRSSWGRVGLVVHSIAGFVDAGYSGVLTFELTNIGRLPIPLYAGLRVAQLIFIKTSSPAVLPYSGKYCKDVQISSSKLLGDDELCAQRNAREDAPAVSKKLLSRAKKKSQEDGISEKRIMEKALKEYISSSENE